MSGNRPELLHNLGYEWWMFRNAKIILDELDGFRDDPVRNALVESLVLHGRGLIDFFFKKAARPQRKRPKDWTAADLGIDLLDLDDKDFEDLNTWRENANKHVLHMTEERAQDSVSWLSGVVLKHLEERFRVVQATVGRDLAADWIGNWQVASRLLVNHEPAPLQDRASGISDSKDSGGSSDSSKTGPTGPSGPR